MVEGLARLGNRSRHDLPVTWAEGLHHSTVNELLRLTLLAPDVIEACLANDSGEIALEHLVRGGSLPLDWPTQRQKLATRR